MTPKPKSIPQLFEHSVDCSGCGACMSACPKNAIEMICDARGFKFPHINASLCIGCNNCIHSCGLHARIGQKTKGPYFAGAGAGDISKSASGGVFSALAQSVLDNDGCVYGAAYVRTEGELHVIHRRADNETELVALLNSKYVQSDASRSFKDVQRELKNGRTVLFAGTPCQVAGLKGFLKTDWPNLLTIDLVCHGVPNVRLFNDQIRSYEDRYKEKVVDFCFRDKSMGWGHSRIRLTLSNGKEISLQASECPYYDLFLKVKTLRDSCYSCPYASNFRAADISLGDFWGVENSRPDVLSRGELTIDNGVSCILVNNDKGRLGIQRYGKQLVLREVTFDDIAKFNDQLRHPSVLPEDRILYLKTYESSGWSKVEQLWKRRERGMMYHIKLFLKGSLSSKGLRNLKRIYEGIRRQKRK